MNVLITGASSGYGLELAIALRESGHKVWEAQRNLRTIKEAEFWIQCEPHRDGRAQLL